MCFYWAGCDKKIISENLIKIFSKEILTSTHFLYKQPHRIEPWVSCYRDCQKWGSKLLWSCSICLADPTIFITCTHKFSPLKAKCVMCWPVGHSFHSCSHSPRKPSIFSVTPEESSQANCMPLRAVESPVPYEKITN